MCCGFTENPRLAFTKDRLGHDRVSHIMDANMSNSEQCIIETVIRTVNLKFAKLGSCGL